MFEVLGLVLSFVGLISIVPQVLSFLSSSLPEGRLKQLDETLKETVELLEAAIQDGLLYNSNFTSRTWSSLHRLRDVTENLRANVLSAPGFYNQCIASFNGLSFRIGETLQSVKVIRARIVSVSDEARQKLLRDSRVHQLSRSGDLEGVTIPSDPSPIPNSGNSQLRLSHAR
ncbi:hypothetical protein BXZ70DRAFT_739366 [Cristinia sonorae]|uniref:Uncharacterized protein n=1 Tax=Cristinia sonorae TaxID=1940300 RepID=A0A8K0UT95_9AGAR|nr:hypothetical protein BXZ70DRAFT_739366 [Cristinia sonorae]